MIVSNAFYPFSPFLIAQPKVGEGRTLTSSISSPMVWRLAMNFWRHRLNFCRFLSPLKPKENKNEVHFCRIVFIWGWVLFFHSFVLSNVMFKSLSLPSRGFSQSYYLWLFMYNLALVQTQCSSQDLSRGHCCSLMMGRIYSKNLPKPIGF